MNLITGGNNLIWKLFLDLRSGTEGGRISSVYSVFSINREAVKLKLVGLIVYQNCLNWGGLHDEKWRQDFRIVAILNFLSENCPEN